MDLFADKIYIRLINIDTERPISNIAIHAQIYANHKNDYFMTYISNEDGNIVINKTELQSEILKNKNLFPMDYSSELDDCISKIEFKLMSVNDISNEIKAMQEWKDILDIQDNEIKKLENVNNGLYIPVSKIIELTGQKIIQVTLDIELRK